MKKIIVLGGTALFLTGILVFSIIHLRTTNEERGRLLGELTSFYSSQKNLGTLPTTELRLSYYKTLHTLDPLMALPGTDTTALRAALAEFAKSSQAAKKPYAASLDGEVLYPITLQQQFANTEDARRALLASPSIASARAYHESLRTLFELYDSSLATMEHMLEEYPAPLVRMWQGDTDSAFVQQQIAHARKDIASQKIKEDARFSCLSGKKTCPPLSNIRSERASLIIPNPTPAPSVPHDAFERRAFYERYYELFRGIAPDPLITDSRGNPLFIELSHGRCTPNGSVAYIAAYTTRSMIRGIPALRFYILDDIYLNDVEKEQLSGFLPSEPKIPENYRYTLQSPNYYTCIDYGYDAHMVLSMTYVYKQLRELPTLSSSEDDILPLVQAAYTITESSVVRDTDMLRFASLTIALYARKGPDYIDAELGQGIANQLLTLAHIIQTRSADFDLMIGMLDNLMDPKLYERADGKPTIDPQWFLVTHANMASQYQLANASVVPSTPSFLKTRNTSAEPFPKTFQGGIVRYDDVLKKSFPTYTELAEHLVATEDYIREVILKD